MKIKTIIIVLGMLLPILSIRAQDIKPLSIGDTVPDLVLHNVINYKDSVIKLSDFKDKLVILDFWSTWCTPCVALIPHISSLSQKYSDAIFLMVTQQSTKEIQQFLNKQGNEKMGKLLIVTDDRWLHQAFRHRSLPHEVWIGKHGIYRSATYPLYLTDANIGLALKDSFPFPRKDELLNNDNMDLSNSFMGYSSLGRYLPGKPKSIIMDTVNHTCRTRLQNLSLVQMALYAKTLPGDFPRSRIKIKETTVQSCFSPSSTEDPDQWKKAHLMCFEMRHPKELPQSEVKNRLMEDLKVFLGIAIKFRKTKVKCLVIDCHTKQTRFYTNKEYKRTMEDLIYDLNQSEMPLPIIVEGKGWEKITTSIKPDTSPDIRKLMALLAKEGCPSRIETRKIDMLYIYFHKNKES